ncbi:MAG: methyltransferase, TIGR04325 family [Acidobacteria bacterium]|nr:methyltransferase, TIGR04325 family [Acidobacteriota bacterium]
MRALVAGAARQIVPPALLNRLLVLGHRLKLIRLKRIWEGEYAHFNDVPAAGPAWSSAAYRKEAVEDAQAILTTTRDTPPGGVADQNGSLLGLLATVLRRAHGGRLRILSVGGGPGTGYAHLSRALGTVDGVEYHAVELPWACEEGARLFCDDPRIRFHESLPDDLRDVDLVYASGVLELFDDWAGALRAFCGYRPRYVLLTNVPCGHFRPYATELRLLPGSRIPMWFLNVNDIVDVMTKHGYELVFRTLLERAYNQDNFRDAARLPGGHPSALLFERS